MTFIEFLDEHFRSLWWLAIITVISVCITAVNIKEHTNANRKNMKG